MVDLLAASDSLQDKILVFVQLRRNDQGNRPSDDLFCSVAEHPLRRRIPAGNNPIHIFAGNSIVRRLDDRS